MADNLQLGQWNVICDRCGFEYKSRQLRKEWTGLRVCDGAGTNECFETRNPQDFLRGRKDQQNPPWVRPEPAEIDVSPGSGNEVDPGDL
tara:strand:- start:10087 stop:10353 length:267 start_codon:yes stop_codon:yes gene_type:complete